MSGALLVLGTSSGAGKTTVVTGLCRWLARRGVAVAPFKAQNMSLNSFVTEAGDEIARAQAVQAWAANTEPDVAMNPVLLKPGSDTRSQVVVMGHPVRELDADDWDSKAGLLDVVTEAFRRLRQRYDVVVCEGAGSPAEVNLRSSDIVNLGFARAAGVPAVVVGDIDRGGVFAAFAGTVALLEPEDQDLVRGFIVNRFRGDVRLLGPALDAMPELVGRRVHGVIPFVRGLGLDAEDALDPELYRHSRSPVGDEVLRVGVVRLPRASNMTDLDPLFAEPGVVVRPLDHPEEMADCDLVVLPGTRATVSDLTWLRQRHFDRALATRAAEGRPVLGICGGYQMLGRRIVDAVESGAGAVDGLCLLPVSTEFAPDKILARRRGTLADGSTVTGYEVRHGRVGVEEGAPLFAGEGCRLGAVAGTTWHGLFENDTFRRSFLADVAATSGRRFVPAGDFSFAQHRQARIDTIADLVDQHVDTDALLQLMAEGGGARPPRMAVSLVHETPVTS